MHTYARTHTYREPKYNDLFLNISREYTIVEHTDQNIYLI